MHLSFWLVLLAVAVTVTVDRVVTERFARLRWHAPVTIAFAPLALRGGMAMDLAYLEKHLEDTGHGRGDPQARAGSWRRAGDVIAYRTAGAAQPLVRIRIADGRIRSLTVDGKAAETVTLPARSLGTLHAQNDAVREPVRAPDLPPDLEQALLLTEDRRFYRHPGVDVAGIARALALNLRAGRAVAGGSTLTQQLAKNLYLSSERTLIRKLKEVMVTAILEARFSKEAILEAYVNSVYLGQSGRNEVRGFGYAAQHYFGRSLDRLDTAEHALLVGLLKGASYYNPWRHPQRARDRRDLVLGLMHDAGALTDSAYRSALARPLGIRAAPREPEHLDLKRLVALGLRDQVRAELLSEGARVETTINPFVQAQLEAALETTLTGDANRLVQAAAVVVDYRSGRLEALVAGARDEVNAFNRTTMARRQIGSLIKPFIYQAFLEDYPEQHPFSMVDDKPVSLTQRSGEVWEPRNYDGVAHGPVPLVEALARSYNLSAVELGTTVGLDALARFLDRVGLERRPQLYPASLLGALSLTPVEVAALYQTLANDGVSVPLYVVGSATAQGQRFVHPGTQAARPTLHPAALGKLRYMLTRVTYDGSARAVRSSGVGWPVAGKTGTTDETRDSWFAVWDEQRLTVIWVGRDDNQPMAPGEGNRALNSWLAFARRTGVAPLALEDMGRWVSAKTTWSGRCAYEEAFPALARPPDGYRPCELSFGR